EEDAEGGLADEVAPDGVVEGLAVPGDGVFRDGPGAGGLVEAPPPLLPGLAVAGAPADEVTGEQALDAGEGGPLAGDVAKAEELLPGGGVEARGQAGGEERLGFGGEE